MQLDPNIPGQAIAIPKKQMLVPLTIQIEVTLRNKLPHLSILAINVVLISTYEFVTITAYIALVLITIEQVLRHRSGNNNNLCFVLNLIAKVLIVAWHINLFTIGMPTR